MTAEDRRRATIGVAAVVGVGLIVRLAMAFTAHGGGFDGQSAVVVRDALGNDLMHFYDNVNGEDTGLRWPYPPAYLVVVAVSGWISKATSWPYFGVIKLAPALADCAIAVVAAMVVARRRPATTWIVGAAAVVAFGPVFIAVSAWHGQFDSFAILPAVIAVAWWDVHRTTTVALAAGALFGLGAAIKTVPGVLVLALLPTATNRQRIAMLATTAAVPAIISLPWLIADFENASWMLRYRGLPGVGGLSLLVQPSLAEGWLHTFTFEPTAATNFVTDISPFLLAGGLIALTLAMTRWRTEPLLASVGVIAVVYVAGANFFFQYAVWGLALLAAAGFVRWAAGIQLAMLVPAIITYGPRPWSTTAVVVPYTILMDVVFVSVVVGLVLLIRSAMAPGSRSTTAPSGR